MMRKPSLPVRAAIGLAAALLLVSSAGAVAGAAPLGTTPITPSAAQCGSETGPRSAIACGAALRDGFLRSRGRSDVVRETVSTPPVGAWAWWSQAGPTFCGYVDFPAVMGLPALATGTHHCDRTTFVVPNRDAALLNTDARATTVLIHESAHGVQEKAGIDVVLPSVLGDVAAQKPMEQSADCWAGVGIEYLIRTGRLPASARGEAAELMGSAAGEDPGTLHGTQSERRAAFDAGYTRGVNACDRLAGRRIFASR